MRRTVLVILFFSASVCFAHLGQGHLAGDAIRYAQIAKHIVASDDWLHLHDPVDEVDSYSNKPPLLFWITALNLKLFNYSTLSTKLPSAVFVFVGIIVLAGLSARTYGQRAALLAVLLYVGNRTFMRDLLDFNVEGIAACGGLLVLLGMRELLSGGRLLPPPRLLASGVTTGTGLLLLSQSKPPYLLVAALPIAAASLLDRVLRRRLKETLFWCGLLPFLALIAGWYLALDRTYLAGAFDNQWVSPIRASRGLVPNVAEWLSAYLISWSPLGILGLFGVRSAIISLRSRRSDAGAGDDPRSSFELLLLLWLLPLIPIILLVDCRPRYILLPMLAMTLFAARAAEDLLPGLRRSRLEAATAAAAAAVILLTFVFEMPVHRVNQLVVATRQYLADAGKSADNSGLPVLCTEANKKRNSAAAARLTSLLVELELGVEMEVMTADQLIEQIDRWPVSFIADLACLRSLHDNGIEVTEREDLPGAKLVTIG